MAPEAIRRAESAGGPDLVIAYAGEKSSMDPGASDRVALLPGPL
jgi:hypothetical protein